ncbi:hypothetical protein fsci_05260 [Francisella sciaenopsi]|uniref:Transposase n=1 Tax=Francisella sciaenopsi TaxID=3055034 RepID=A0ABQ6PDM5_9GAMM
MLKNNKYPLDTRACIIVVKLTPRGYSAQTLNNLIAVTYITLHDNMRRIIAIVKPHEATIKGKDSIPAPIVVPIIKKTEPIDLEFIKFIIIFY